VTPEMQTLQQQKSHVYASPSQFSTQSSAPSAQAYAQSLSKSSSPSLTALTSAPSLMSKSSYGSLTPPQQAEPSAQSRAQSPHIATMLLTQVPAAAASGGPGETSLLSKRIGATRATELRLNGASAKPKMTGQWQREDNAGRVLGRDGKPLPADPVGTRLKPTRTGDGLYLNVL
jgi:hypothetical protein